MFYRYLLLVGLLVCCQAYAAIEVIDDNGDKLSLNSAANRIISLSPNTTEILFHIGAGSKIVGADEYSNYPPAANDIIRVNNHAAANYELIISLKPDLVIAWQSGNGEKIIARLRELGLPVFVVETQSMADIPSLYKRLGELSGQSKQAKKQADIFADKLQQLHQSFASRAEIRTFYQIWNDPLMTLNGDHILTDIIELCGGVNVFEDSVALVPYVNMESVLAKDPQVIISGGANQNDLWDLGIWQKWSGLSAVKNKQIYSIPSDLLQRHSDRILQGAELVCQHLEQARAASRTVSNKIAPKI
jgi:iron complex transport system substrate-binding protein